MQEQFRPSSLGSPGGYAPGRTSHGGLRDDAPYRIARKPRRADSARGVHGQAASGERCQEGGAALPQVATSQVACSHGRATGLPTTLTTPSRRSTIGR